MKKIIKHSLMVLGAIIGLTSCDKVEGPVYSGDADKASFFTNTAKLLMADGQILVPISRSASANELSFPVVLTATGKGYLDIFSANEPVKFASGEVKSYAKISYGDVTKINPSALSVSPIGNDATVGLAFPLILTIPKESLSTVNVPSVNVTATQVLEFEEIGDVKFDSSDGWAEEVLTVKAQKAKGTSVYKIMSPFGGNTIAFQIQSDGKTVTFPNQVAATAPGYGGVTMSGVTGTIVGKVVTLKVASYAVSAGSFGSGVEVITLP